MSNVWFTSDHHFGHSFVNRIRKDTLRAADLDQATKMLIGNWNDRIERNDRVYHLGDFALCKPGEALQILAALKGQIYLIRGNHDGVVDNAKVASQFVGVWDYKELKLDGQKIVLSHYPFLTWLHSGKGSWCLHGHCHGNLPELPGKRLDVGVDCHGFAPIDFDMVRKLMAKKDIDACDHRTYGEAEAGANGEDHEFD